MSNDIVQIIEFMGALPEPNHELFLRAVEDYITKYPTVAPHVTEFVARGIEKSRKSLVEQASEMENALAQALYRRFYAGKVKKLTEQDKFVLEKINKWRKQRKNFIQWDWLFEKLDEEVLDETK
jgi:hypothetical protein